MSNHPNLDRLMASEEQERAFAQGYKQGRQSVIAEVREQVMRTHPAKRTPSDRRASWFFRRSDIAFKRGDLERAAELEQWAMDEASRHTRELT